MENITHSLIGYALARAVPARRQASPAEAAALAWTSVLASNLPDIDIVLGRVGADAQLTYMVQHRGYTHSLPFIPIAAALAVAIAVSFTRLARDRSVLLRLFALGLVAALLHVAFDALNDYGVHPFWPFDNRWFYGDSVFIVEPLFYFSLLPFVILGAGSRPLRGLCALLALLTLIALAAMRGVFSPDFVFGAAWLLAMLALEARFGRTRRGPALLPLAGLAIAIVIFVGAGHEARSRVRNDPELLRAGETMLEVVSTPLPGNALCWSTLAIARTPTDELVVRRAALSLAPSWIAPRKCRMYGDTPVPDLTSPPAQSARGDRVLEGEFRASLAELRALSTRSCRARALLTLLRAPFWRAWREGGTLLGDLRYDRNPGRDFAEFVIADAKEAECPALPPWVPPREDALRVH